MSSAEDYSQYAECERYELNDPFLFMDVVNSLESKAEVKYSEINRIIHREKVSSERALEDHFIPLEDSRRRYFQEYILSVGSDNEIILEKEYDQFNFDVDLPIDDSYSKIKFRVRGKLPDEGIQSLHNKLK